VDHFFDDTYLSHSESRRGEIVVAAAAAAAVVRHDKKFHISH
jgi:hypothetical protein